MIIIKIGTEWILAQRETEEIQKSRYASKINSNLRADIVDTSNGWAHLQMLISSPTDNSQIEELVEREHR